MTANPPFRTIQLQRDTAANWTSANTLLAEGELGLEMDTRKAKIGDGVTQWNSLQYAFSSIIDTHTGDVTGGIALTISNGAVTNTKMANMATKTYKGRTSAATGVAEDVAVTTLKEDLVLVKADVGLGSVDNTSDATKNSATTTLENKTIISPVITVSINAQTGTTYTLVLTDQSKLITLTNAAAIAVTIPTNASVAFPIGTQIDCSQDGVGKVTFSGAGVTINSLSSLKSIGGQYVGVSLIKKATDTWNLYGNLIA